MKNRGCRKRGSLSFLHYTESPYTGLPLSHYKENPRTGLHFSHYGKPLYGTFSLYYTESPFTGLFLTGNYQPEACYPDPTGPG
jgi:hypothetical protein